MLTEREQGRLSNLALEMAPGQDMHFAQFIYRDLCAGFEREWEELFRKDVDDDDL